MRTVTRLCALAALSLICAAAATAQSPTSKTFISKEGRFAVQLSSRPTYSLDRLGSDAGAGTNHVFLLAKGETAYYISYTDFDPAIIKAAGTEKVLDGARNGGVANSKGALLSEKSISLDGNPGREISIDVPGTPKTHARARFYIVENRLYSIIYGSPAAGSDGPQATAFLASLKLQKHHPLPDNWNTLDSLDGRFSIKMPGTPTLSVDKPEKKDAVHLWQLINDKDKIAYFVAYNDLPEFPTDPAQIEIVLDKGRDALAKSMSATVVDESLLDVDGNPGREVHLRAGTKAAPTGIIIFQEVIVKDRYYQVMTIGSKESMEKGRSDDYMASFQLTPVKK